MKRKQFGSTHDEALSRLCFVCGEIIKETFFYAVDEHLDLLAAALNCPSLFSIPDVTPLNFCKKCHLALSMVKNGGTVKTGRTLLEWEECGSECKTCGILTKRKQVRGRQKKVKRGGRPKLGTWSLTSIPTPEEVKYDIDISLVRPNNSEDALKHCLCIYCEGLIVGPIMLKCEHGSCYRCFVDNNFKKPIEETVCLTCEARIESDSDIKTSGFLQTCIDNLNSKCNKGSCDEVIPLKCWSDHTNSCTGQPKSITPMIGKEMRVLLAQSQNGRIEIPTGGQPICVQHIPKPRKDKKNVSPETLRKKRSCIAGMIESQFGEDGEDFFVADVIRRKGRKDREKILHEMGLGGEMTEEQGLAMMVDLGTTWSMFRKLKRWLTLFGIKSSAENRMRNQIKEWKIGDDIACEKTPFQISKDRKTGKEVIKARAMAYVIDLKGRILRSLDLLFENNLFTEYESMQNEVHIKIGGDHGGKSFKMSYQNCNRINPNSKDNTVVFCMFEAKDKKVNLRTALTQYKESVAEMQCAMWRGRKIRVFMFGDYDFLSQMYGLSGASGKHPCLWCTVTSQQMQLPPSQRTVAVVERTLESMKSDLTTFREKFKGNLKNAMDANNVIDEPFFNIPLNQVVVPGLHLTLGIFPKMFNVFEQSCRRLDYRLLRSSDESVQVDESVMDELFFKEGKIFNFEESLATCTDTFLYQLSQFGDDDIEERQLLEATYKQHRDKVEDMITKLVKDLDAFKKKHNLEQDDGPIKLRVEEALQAKEVERQAYHSNSFIGNHCHMILKDRNYEDICSVPMKVVSDQAPNNTYLNAAALNIQEKFTEIFKRYSACHMLFNSRTTVDHQLLATLIEDFMSHWRVNFPNETVSPKMHMLEDHIVPFLEKWKLGCGFYGEQGGESLHHEFNEMRRIFGGMNDPVKRLRSMLKRHHVNTCPKNLNENVKPAIKTRGSYKKKTEKVE